MEYKQIEGYENYYVCDSGVNKQTVLSVRDNYGNPRFKWISPDKESKIHLFKNHEKIGKLIYRLLAEAFIPIPEEYKNLSVDKLVVHHIDHNRSNNRLENFMWVTPEKHRELHRDSEISKERRHECRMGEKNHNYGKHFSEEHRRKIGKANKGKCKGRVLAEETRMKISKALSGRIRTEEHCRKLSEAQMNRKDISRPVEQWSLDGTTLIARYASTMEAERQTGIKHTNISACCKGKAKSAGGYKWRYASD